MKSYPYIFLLIAISLFSCAKKEPLSLEDTLKTTVNNQIDSLNTALIQLSKCTKKDSAKIQFSKCRAIYKKTEPFVEYYFQGFSRRINGPALPDIKIDDNVVNDPTGFQVIEEVIFSDEELELAKLKSEIEILKTDLLFVKNNLKDFPIQNHHLYELLQHQIIRTATMGITGFDSPVAFLSIRETNNSLEGIQQYFAVFCKKNEVKSIEKCNKLISKSQAYLIKNNNFDIFNRLVFIKNYLMPLSVELEIAFKDYLKESPNGIKPFNGTLSDLMQGKGFNPDAFSPFADSKTNAAKIALGKQFFNDKNLSKNNTISCASCHNADKAFTDGLQFSTVKVHNQSTSRNSPTLMYAAFQKSFFYDLRSQDLENQIEEVMKNPNEFNLSTKEITARITQQKVYKSLLAKSFPNKKEITPFEIRNAIASYVRSLMPFNAKIDNYFKGKVALTKEEENGFNLFAGKAKCASCHFIPLYNGTVPPWYNNSESEVIGVPKSINWKNAVVDSDLGRYNTNQIEQFRFSFKTPTIRNIAKTAPYMHNGVFTNLEDILKFYELGGGNGIGMQLGFQTLPFDNLKLTEREKKDIILFMKTLTDN
jgi:cytochrome c peroxidase